MPQLNSVISKSHHIFANTDEISDDALVWNQEDLALEAIAQKFTQEVDELNSEE